VAAPAEAVLAAAGPAHPVTLEEALAAVREKSLEAGVMEKTLVMMDANGRFLCRYFEPTARVSDISLEDVEWFIAAAQKPTFEGKPNTPRAVNTIKQKDLPLLARVFKAAKVSVDVREARNLPKGRRPVRDIFDFDAALAIIERVRNWTRVPHGRMDRGTARYHADLLELMLRTAVRPCEFARIKLSDVDLTQGIIRVELPKVDALPRSMTITPALRPVVLRLIGEARARGYEGFVPHERYVPDKVFRKWKLRLGEPKMSARLFRRSSITALLSRGASIPQVMDFAGHSTASTTDKYLQALDSREAAALLDSPGPVAQLAERLVDIEEVDGSSPFGSTTSPLQRAGSR